MMIEWNPETREVFADGLRVERVAVYFVDGNAAPVAEWRDPGPQGAQRSVACEISISTSARERERAVATSPVAPDATRFEDEYPPPDDPALPRTSIRRE